MPHGIASDTKMFFGSDGKPFLTKKKVVPDYKDNYPLYMQPKAVRHVSVDVLDLSDEGDLDYYLKIWRAVGLGSVVVAEESKQWIDDKKCWKVLIRWYIQGKMDPSELRQEIAKATRGLRQGVQPAQEEEGE